MNEETEKLKIEFYGKFKDISKYIDNEYMDYFLYYLMVNAQITKNKGQYNICYQNKGVYYSFTYQVDDNENIIFVQNIETPTISINKSKKLVSSIITKPVGDTFDVITVEMTVSSLEEKTSISDVTKVVKSYNEKGLAIKKTSQQLEDYEINYNYNYLTNDYILHDLILRRKEEKQNQKQKIKK